MLVYLWWGGSWLEVEAAAAVAAAMVSASFVLPMCARLHVVASPAERMDGICGTRLFLLSCQRFS